MFSVFDVRCSVSARLLKFTIQPNKILAEYLRVGEELSLLNFFFPMYSLCSKPVGLLHKQGRSLL